ncbi:MAG TPA: ABC transporter permease subunit [Isosphaeraceae bacterium]|jgi:ABC-type Fe3+ transport system permease subunit|nr:ABC transporter permease subunit [Isosphaeraceae bacterium]
MHEHEGRLLMRVVRGLGWLAGAAIGVAVLAPVGALLPAAIIDRGSAGSVRGSLLYVALAVFDPFVWTCLGNSLMVALAVAVGSWWIGVGLARMIGRWRFWARRPLATLVWVPLAVPPLVAALGVRGIIARLEPWPGPGWNMLPWLAWVWIGLTGGVPLVALVAKAALGRVDPAWEEAARQAGGSRRQVWWTIAWPIARPETARAVASVFALMLFEPGAPLILGLRRTLAFQVVEAALAGPTQFPRAALLTLMALAIVASGRLLLRWWSRSPWPAPAVMENQFPPRARWLRAAAMTSFLAAWAAVGILPTFSVLAMASAPIRHEPQGSVSASSPSVFTRLRRDPDTARLAATSLGLGAGAAALGLGLASGLIASAGWHSPRWSRWRRLAASLPEACPPLAIGVGASFIPWIVGAAADGLFASQSLIASGLHGLADGLDPYRTPGLLLVVSLMVMNLPMLARAATIGQQRTRPRLTDAARSLGASRLRARRTMIRFWLGSTPGAAFVLATALAATSLAPALVLAPTSEGEPVSVAILRLADQPGDSLRRACTFATAAIGLNLAALAFAARCQPGPLGTWFRG